MSVYHTRAMDKPHSLKATPKQHQNRNVRRMNERCIFFNNRKDRSQQNYLFIPRSNHVFAYKCIRYSITRTANSSSYSITGKVYTHSLYDFSIYIKQYVLIVIMHTTVTHLTIIFANITYSHLNNIHSYLVHS